MSSRRYTRTKLPKIEQDGYNPFEQFIKEGKETR